MGNAILEMKPTVEQPDTGIDGRKRLAGNLSGMLADTYLLLVKTQGYHWNVVGPRFVSIHRLTKEHYENLFAAGEMLAERIRALGYPAPTSVTEMITQTEIIEDTGNPSAHGMMDNLVQDHETIARRLRSAAELADELRDRATADLLTRRIEFHEEAIWMLRAIVTS